MNSFDAYIKGIPKESSIPEKVVESKEYGLMDLIEECPSTNIVREFLRYQASLIKSPEEIMFDENNS